MRAGRLRNKVLLQRPNAIRSDDGGVVDSWVTVAEVFANINPRKGGESTVNGGVLSRFDTTISIHATSCGVSPRWRVVCDGTIFNVVSVVNDMMFNRYITLECVSGLNDG